ncbi:MAG: hypothetical protein K5989_04375 [Lachnospiraceae bacterium]|nr:hypothetical protein [Lachnospiraceae bacterium]
MGKDKLDFFQEQERINEWELMGANQETLSNTEFGYRDMNSRFLNMEKEFYKGNDLAEKINAHEERKKMLESAWHKNTSKQAKAIRKNNKHKNQKKPEFYRDLSLAQIEILMKNSDRGGNSEEYNSVATDLEIYNHILNSTNENEKMTLLNRLKESCTKYLSEKTSPVTTNGKIRKAMVMAISDKVTLELQEIRENTFSNRAETFKEFQEDKSAESVNKALLAHYNMLNLVLTDNLTITDDERLQLDEHMVSILNELKKQPVDENQNNVMATKFFNALGWASNTPRRVDIGALNERGSEFKKSPLKKTLYHTINPLSEDEDAKDMAKQLVGLGGKNDKAPRQYYSNGITGKGTYLAAKSDNEKATDKNTSVHCWRYGKDLGAIQLSLLFNENARIVDELHLRKLVNNKLMKDYPKIYNFFIHSEKYTYGASSKEYFTMLAALFGYNTIKAFNKLNTPDNPSLVDYYVTTDRKALTVSCDVMMRLKGTEKDFLDLREE